MQNPPTTFGSQAQASAKQGIDSIPSSPTDLIGRYFQIFDAAMGEFTEMEFITTTDDGRVESHRFHHAQCDAQGGLLKLSRLRVEGELTLPRQRSEKRPGFLRQLILMTSYLKRMKISSKPTLKHSSSKVHENNSKAHTSLTILETSQIQAFVKSLGISTTAYLTWSLHKAIGVASGKVDHSCQWSIPVNLRGPLILKTPEANYAVPLFLAIDSSTPATAIHESIRSQLDEGMHWGAYRMLAILGRLPTNLYAWMIRRDELSMRDEGRWFAILSNVGSIKGCTRVLSRAAIAPTDPTTPITGTALSWNDRMTLGLSVHSSFHGHGLQAAKLLSAWMGVISQSVTKQDQTASILSTQDQTRGEG